MKWILCCLSFLLWVPLAMSADTSQIAYFSGGCFWCMQSDFDKVPGVVKTVVGYMGGTKPNPTYELVSSGATNYAESIQVFYDPSRTSYEKLLNVFWHSIDPLDANGQFCDKGRQYRAEIFTANAEQQALAEKSKQALIESKQFDQPIVVEISSAGTFYPAEKYHQNYYKKNPLRYKFYRYRCGRDERLKQLWG